MSYPITPADGRLMTTTLNLVGNVVPDIWLQRLVYPQSKKPNWLAVWILSDICYWYSPSEIRDDRSGAVIGYGKKYKSDLLQRSYADIMTRTGCEKKQAQRACKLLEEYGLIKLHFRTMTIGGVKCANIMFVEPIIAGIRALTYNEVWTPVGGGMDTHVHTYGHGWGEGVYTHVHTNTVNTPIITTTKENDSVAALVFSQFTHEEQEPIEAAALPVTTPNSPFTPHAPSRPTQYTQNYQEETRGSGHRDDPPPHLKGFQAMTGGDKIAQVSAELAKGLGLTLSLVGKFYESAQTIVLNYPEQEAKTTVAVLAIARVMMANCRPVAPASLITAALELYTEGYTLTQINSLIDPQSEYRRQFNLKDRPYPSQLVGWLIQAGMSAPNQQVTDSGAQEPSAEAIVFYEKWIKPLENTDKFYAIKNWPTGVKKICQASGLDWQFYHTLTPHQLTPYITSDTSKEL